MQLRMLVLPAPFGPMSASSSPLLAWNETSCSTRRPPKASDTDFSSSSAIPPSAAAILLHVAVALARAAAKVELLDVLVRAQALGRAIEHDPAVFHHVAVVGHVEGDPGVLLDHEERRAERRAYRPQPRDQLVHDEWRESQRELVDEEELRRAHQRRADREHLALAAGKVAGLALPQRGERREIFVDRVLGELARADRCVEILVHGEVLEHLAALGHQRDAVAGNAMRCKVGDVCLLEKNLSLGDPRVVLAKEARDRSQRRRLAGTVVAEEGDDRSFWHFQ